jgi:hypothetical protein
VSSIFQSDLRVCKSFYELFEAPRSKLLGMFCLAAVLRSDRKEVCHFQIRSLTPQQAAGNALAFAVQDSLTTPF